MLLLVLYTLILELCFKPQHFQRVKNFKFKAMHWRRLCHLPAKHKYYVLQGSVETLFRWGGERLHHVMANLIRKICTKFYQNRLGFVEEYISLKVGRWKTGLSRGDAKRWGLLARRGDTPPSMSWGRRNSRQKYNSSMPFTARRKASFASGCICLRHIRLSVRMSSVRHTPVLCENEGTQRNTVFTVGNPACL